jgi:hypothetical protein
MCDSSSQSETVKAVTALTDPQSAESHVDPGSGVVKHTLPTLSLLPLGVHSLLLMTYVTYVTHTVT